MVFSGRALSLDFLLSATRSHRRVFSKGVAQPDLWLQKMLLASVRRINQREARMRCTETGEGAAAAFRMRVYCVRHDPTRPDPTRGGGMGGGESCSWMQNTFCRRSDRDSMTDGRARHPYRVTAGTGNKQQTLMRALKVVRVMFGITDVGLQLGCLSRGQLQGPCSGAERGGMYSLDWWSRLLNRTRWAG